MPMGYNIRLRPLTPEERQALGQLARAQSTPALVVGWAKILQAVADGVTYQASAHAAGQKSRDAVTDFGRSL